MANLKEKQPELPENRTKSLTTKELKKKNIHPDWLEGQGEVARVERTQGKGAAGEQGK